MIRAALERTLWPLTAPIGSVCAVRTSAPEVVLTFDDGPEPGGTDRVLAALAERGATATFFVLVRRAEREPVLLREVRDAGHEIALHGVDHRRLTRLPLDTVRRGLRDGRARLEDLLGQEIRWFRAPYGAQSPAVWREIRGCGIVPVVWGPAARDWLGLPIDRLAGNALRRLERGSVLLAHDGFAGPEDGVDDGPAPAVDRGALVRRVLDGMAERGLTGRSLGSVLDHGTESHRAWFKW